MRIGVTGGAGYIGAHVVVELLQAGHEVVVVDNFSAGHLAALERAQAIAGRPCAVVPADIADAPKVRAAFAGVEAVIHFAASKLVGESMHAPATYFRNNVGGMATLLETLDAIGVRRFVYSSSAAVYGTQEVVPIAETAPLRPENPYGLTKVHGEQMLDWMVRLRGWHVVSLRYFNPVGAHESGRIGQPLAGAVALVPRVLDALRRPHARVSIFGTDWPTADGTCLRDYIHVSDLSLAHLRALDVLGRPEHQIFNVGTGRPHGVREVIAACDIVSGLRVPADAAPRRAGDMAVAVADPTRFTAATGFRAERGLMEMVESAWRWAVQNPEGYGAA
jgi:UDP-glucose 4-epimerase